MVAINIWKLRSFQNPNFIHMIFKSNLFATTALACTLLFVSCSKDEDNTPIEEPQNTASLLVREDVQFAVGQDGTDSKRFYATSTGKMYSFDEIDAEIGATIDLVWYDSSPTNPGFLFWESPDNLFGDLEMPGATATKIENYQPSLNAEQFDLIENKEQLTILPVTHSEDAMGPIEYPVTILFENSQGKKGVIKMKSNDGTFLTVDIKVVN